MEKHSNPKFFGRKWLRFFERASDGTFMEWLIPLSLVVMGALSIGFEHLLRRYVESRVEPGHFQKARYYSVQQLAERFERRQSLSWAMITFGFFWCLTNLI
ncbi:MAG TPA: hypothetical protein VM901_01620 [Bdellovibrionota bacterium]|jgi:hypothetical protein|nr:hypothetical protein [Bdellovibrionota bacterium]